MTAIRAGIGTTISASMRTPGSAARVTRPLTSARLAQILAARFARVTFAAVIAVGFAQSFTCRSLAPPALAGYLTSKLAGRLTGRAFATCLARRIFTYNLTIYGLA